tara:strand:- start:354 stop:725 length:372 start_codon:yes stop_codon:yes gene_type:complete
MKTSELINGWHSFSDADKELLSLAVCTRGKNKGFLLANKPKGKPGMVWDAVMLTVAPARSSLFGAMSGNEDDRKAFADTCDLMSANFGMAIKASEPAFRWNLFAHRYDCEKLLNIFKKEGFIA